MKKILSMLVLLAMILSCCAVASAETTGRTGTTLFPCDENGYPDLGGVTITIWMPGPGDPSTSGMETYGDLKVIQNFEEMLNVNLEFVHPSVGGEQEGFSTMIATGDYPDMIFEGYVGSYYAGGLAMAYEDGLIYDYTELVSPETTPNYWAYVMEDPYLAKSAVDDFGRNVHLGSQVSGSEEICTCMWGLMIRQDLLTEAGLELPETIDDWTAMLRKFKEMGVKYPLLLNKSGYWLSRNAFSCAWNIDARNFNITEDGKVVYGPATPEYKDYMKTMATWYQEGLINPDFTSDTQQDTWSMMGADEGGAVADHTYNYTPYYHVPMDPDNNPEEQLVAAQMPKLNADDPLTRVMITNRGLGKQKCILDSSEYKKECVALLDAMYYPEIEFMFSNGIEGIGYNLNEYGYPVITDVEYQEGATDEEKRSIRIYAFETESDSDLEYITTSKYCNGPQPDTCILYSQCGYDLIWPSGASFTAEEADIIAEYKTDIETYRDEMRQKFMTGVLDIEAEYDAYVEQLNALGLAELTEVYQAAYDRYVAR